MTERGLTMKQRVWLILQLIDKTDIVLLLMRSDDNTLRTKTTWKRVSFDNARKAKSWYDIASAMLTHLLLWTPRVMIQRQIFNLKYWHRLIFWVCFGIAFGTDLRPKSKPLITINIVQVPLFCFCRVRVLFPFYFVTRRFTISDVLGVFGFCVLHACSPSKNGSKTDLLSKLNFLTVRTATMMNFTSVWSKAILFQLAVLAINRFIIHLKFIVPFGVFVIVCCWSEAGCNGGINLSTW